MIFVNTFIRHKRQTRNNDINKNTKKERKEIIQYKRDYHKTSTVHSRKHRLKHKVLLPLLLCLSCSALCVIMLVLFIFLCILCVYTFVHYGCCCSSIYYNYGYRYRVVRNLSTHSSNLSNTRT